MATARNAYVNLRDFLEWYSPQDVTNVTIPNSVINTILDSVSRWIDNETNRYFYPTIDTFLYDFPEGDALYLPDDLLEVITLTNGDGTVLTTSNYFLYPANSYPKSEIRIKLSSSSFWAPSTTDGVDQAISLKAWFGYHEKYSREAWGIADTTLGAEITDTTTLDFTASSGHSLTAGQVIKIEDEILIVDSVSSNVMTVFKRGDNGSTAATHANGKEVFIWKPDPAIVLAVKQISKNIESRFGSSAGEENIVLPTGVVVTPRDLTSVDKLTIRRLSRLT